MLNEKDIKPIPKYILQLIRKKDKTDILNRNGRTRYYAYLTKQKGELVKVTVACKNKGKNWYCKQVAIHDVHSPHCLVRDMACLIIYGYIVGWYEQGLSYYRKWWEDGKWFESKRQYFNVYSPIVNIEYAFKFPQYKYSAVDRYDDTNIMKYLRFYEQYPQAELLVKFGLYHYATSKQILRLTSKDKKFGKWLIKNRSEIQWKGYYVSTIIKAYKSGKPLANVQLLEKAKKEFRHSYTCHNIKNLFKTDKELEKLFEYLEKQNTNLNAYDDYLKACLYLGLDMSLDKNVFPHNFRHWHDIHIDEYSTAVALKHKKEREEMYVKFANIAQKYLPLQKDTDNMFVVLIAKSPQDLIHEGEILHHCVGRMNYDQRMLREESLIFFIRDKNSPDTPFVTVEYSIEQHKVLQCYGYQDSRPDDKVLNFVNKKWLPYANKQLKKIA